MISCVSVCVCVCMFWLEHNTVIVFSKDRFFIMGHGFSSRYWSVLITGLICLMEISNSAVCSSSSSVCVHVCVHACMCRVSNKSKYIDILVHCKAKNWLFQKQLAIHNDIIIHM